MGPVLLSVVKVLLVAQAAQATIVGTVRDTETAGPIAGAVVSLTDLDRAAPTDDDGRYALRRVPAGPHEITVRFIGYARHSLQALVPRDGELEINVSLNPEPVLIPTLDVHAPMIVRGVDLGDASAFPDRQVSAAAVRNHPLLGEPDAFEALGGGEVFLEPEAPIGVHVRGGGSDQTAYLLDGIPVLNPYHAAGMSSGWNPDALSRLRLSSTMPLPAYPHALSGAIEAVTRAPGDRLRAQGSFSTTQSRLTFDGPLGRTGAGYLVSLRSGLRDLSAPKREPSYLKGGTGDWLAKLEVPALRGRLLLLGYGNENDLNTSAVTTTADGTVRDPRRNVFEWSSRSLGAQWRGVLSSTTVRVVAWSAAGDAGSLWSAKTAPIDMTAARRDEGLLVSAARSSPSATTVGEIRFERSRASYRVEPDSTHVPFWTLAATTPVATGIVRHTREISRRVGFEAGGSLALMGAELYLDPSARLRWSALEELAFSASYARTHQFSQSLRNAESAVGNIFPVDLFMGAGSPGVPVAGSEQRVVSAIYRPRAGARLGLQAYERFADGLLLVAPREVEPFSTGAFAVGSSVSRGVSVDAAVSAARYGIVASYGFQRVRLAYEGSGYVPENGAAHLLGGGVIVFPSATTSIRLGASAAMGRRATSISDGFEWEACNLLDRGCEFGGSPHTGSIPGGTAVPAYFRLDVGARKLWHLGAGGRGATIALFGTATNILGRKNVLTYAVDRSTGEPIAIEMRPRAPLVVGLDWIF